MKRLPLVAAYFIVSVWCEYQQGFSQTIRNEEIEVQHAERMDYPLAARIHATQGSVVLKLAVRTDGTVQFAEPLSGDKNLIPDCLKNAAKWRFSRTDHGTAIVVYVFRLEGLCDLPCPGNFSFYPPNVIVVSIGHPLATP